MCVWCVMSIRALVSGPFSPLLPLPPPLWVVLGWCEGCETKSCLHHPRGKAMWG